MCMCLFVCFSQNVKTNLEDSFSTHLLGQAKCVHSFDKNAKVTPSLEPPLSIWSTTVQIPVYCSPVQQYNWAKHSVCAPSTVHSTDTLEEAMVDISIDWCGTKFTVVGRIVKNSGQSFFSGQRSIKKFQENNYQEKLFQLLN